MKSDDVATKLIHIEWERTRKEANSPSDFFGIVKLGEIELKRFQITRDDYTSDRCAPCQSSAKKFRDEIAKGIREGYGE